MRARSIALVLAAALVIGACGSAAPSPTPTPTPSATASPSPSVSPSPSASPSVSPSPSLSPSPSPSGFDMTTFSLTDPTSRWVIVNKHRCLDPLDYAPKGLESLSPIPMKFSGQQMRAEAAAAMKRMWSDAKKDGVTWSISSSYRTYAFQSGIFYNNVNTKGREAAERSSARPGCSEHQTGWATDIYQSDACRLQQCFGDEAAGKWVEANAHKYGFIVRYPRNKEGVTGYIWEPWHMRYVGVQLAVALHESEHTTLEDFFGLEPAPSYLSSF